MFWLKQGPQPTSVEKLFEMMSTRIERDAVQLANRKILFKRVDLLLSPLDAQHYQPFLSDLRASLMEQLLVLYRKHGVEGAPECHISFHQGATQVVGDFEKKDSFPVAVVDSHEMQPRYL